MSFSYYASTTNQKTDASTWTDLGGLSLTLPRGGHTDASRNTALVILNVPNPYATGNSNPGATFGITVNGVLAEPFASFTYAEKAPASYARVPTTLVVQIVLSTEHETVVKAQWQAIRGATVVIDSPATLSAVVG